MGNSYSNDYTAEDHIHRSITHLYNIEEPHQKYRIGTVSNRLMGEREGGLNKFYRIRTLALSFYIGSKNLVRMKVF